MTATTKDVGLETLERIGDSLGRYNRWLYEQLAPYVRGRVLEIGSGVGNLSPFLLGNEEVYLTDVSSEYIETLESKFGGLSHVKIARWDLGAEPPDDLTAGHFDAIVCSNVLEHVEDDGAALARMHRLLRPGGCLLLLVPAHQALYNSFDRGLEHHRRYDRRSLDVLLRDHGFAPERIWYFNVLGALGWYLNGTVLKKEILPKGQMKLFDLLVPVLRFEQILRPPFGVSVISVCHKTERSPASALVSASASCSADGNVL